MSIKLWEYFKEKGGGVGVYLAMYQFSNIVHASGDSPIMIRKLMLTC